jgi:hypothetical protein
MGGSGFALILGIGFLVSVLLIVFHASRSSFRIAAGLVAWYGAVVVLGRSGLFAQTPLIAPNIIFAFFFLFIILWHFYHSATLRAVADATAPYWMIAVHVWRIGGVWFISLYYVGVLPAEFAFPSGIGDLVVGIAALPVAYFLFLQKPFSRKIAIVWNYIGAADLLLAVSLGILAYPEPFPPLIDGQVLTTSVSTGALALYPLALIPLFAVPLSLLLHAFSLRALKNTA